MEGFSVRCLYCGPFIIDLDRSAVEQLHEHADSQSHKCMVRLDQEFAET